MAQLQRDFLALIPNFTKENIQSFNSIHFIDEEFRNISLLESYVLRNFGLSISIDFNDKDILLDRLESSS